MPKYKYCKKLFLKQINPYKCIYFKYMKEEEQKQIKLNLNEKKEIIFRLLNQRTQLWRNKNEMPDGIYQ